MSSARRLSRRGAVCVRQRRLGKFMRRPRSPVRDAGRAGGGTQRRSTRRRGPCRDRVFLWPSLCSRSFDKDGPWDQEGLVCSCLLSSRETVARDRVTRGGPPLGGRRRPPELKVWDQDRRRPAPALCRAWCCRRISRRHGRVFRRQRYILSRRALGHLWLSTAWLGRRREGQSH